MQMRQRKLKFWNGRVPGKESVQMYVAATSRGKAAELITKASSFKVNSVFVKSNLNTVWGEPMDMVEPKEGVWFLNENSQEVQQIV